MAPRRVPHARPVAARSSHARGRPRPPVLALVLVVLGALPMTLAGVARSEDGPSSGSAPGSSGPSSGSAPGSSGRTAPAPPAPAVPPSGGPPPGPEAAAEPRTAVTFEPLGAIQARAFAVELERRLVPGWSLALQPVLVFASQAVTRPDGTVGREDALVWGASLHLRAFVAGDGLTGLFAGPVLTASTGGFRAADGNGASGPDGVTASTPVAIAAGALLGYNHLLGRPFLLSLGLGAQYHLRLDGDRTLRDGRFLPLLRLAIGAAF